MRQVTVHGVKCATAVARHILEQRREDQVARDGHYLGRRRAPTMRDGQIWGKWSCGVACD